MVNLPPLAGVRLAAVKSHIRYPDRLDLVLIELSSGAEVAGVFTGNAFSAAPVKLAKHHLLEGDIRYFLINTGNANAGTGEAGYLDARRCCRAVAELAGVRIEQILPFSTGVIGEALPVERIEAGIPGVYGALGEANWLLAAQGIMTTDTRPKTASVALDCGGKALTVNGIAKGAGMIKPNMATMLAFVFTDASVPQETLKTMLSGMVERSFNRITVDGDTSTNDACMLVATGEGEVDIAKAGDEERQLFEQALQDVFRTLATEIIRDAEGGSKFVTIGIEGGRSSAECLQVAYAIAESPLVKTALFASDPNWGRILAAIGRAGVTGLEVERVMVRLGDVCLVKNGTLADDYTERRGKAEMQKSDIEINVDLGRGSHRETVWTSDLSLDYVRINAEYRS
ncbi:MAG: bifunctional glutamate N-acetyltransferase/amino-acid acetyltransferase ArgJ [Pseudohongiellaceae bacterium]